MLIDSERMVSATEAARNASKLFNSAAEDTAPWVVMNGNKPTALICGFQNMDRLNRIDELEEDLRMLSVAIVRWLTDDGVRHDLADVAAEFGVDLTEE